uniref:TYMS opposite strand protein n=1 Tax=Urocitellus parryii TaxID=9999 RepID=UPI000E560807|nr:TYMS opposite strand protein [Urocitellus parryii]
MQTTRKGHFFPGAILGGWSKTFEDSPFLGRFKRKAGWSETVRNKFPPAPRFSSAFAAPPLSFSLLFSTFAKRNNQPRRKEEGANPGRAQADLSLRSTGRALLHHASRRRGRLSRGAIRIWFTFQLCQSHLCDPMCIISLIRACFRVCKAGTPRRPLPPCSLRSRRLPRAPSSRSAEPAEALPPSQRGPSRGHLSGCSVPACQKPTGCRCRCGPPS